MPADLLVVPFAAEPVTSLRARYAASLNHVYDVAYIRDHNGIRPGEVAANIFDFEDGLRLIVSRDACPDGRQVLHYSASFMAECRVADEMRRTAAALSHHQALHYFLGLASWRFEDSVWRHAPAAIHRHPRSCTPLGNRMTAQLIERCGDGRVVFHWHPGQLRAWDSEKQTVAIIGGGRSGKTSIGPAWLHREMQLKGPGDYLVAAPSYKIIDKAAGPETRYFFEHLCGYGRMTGGNSPQFRFSAAGAKRLWGRVPEKEARILFAHADDPETLESFSGKAAWLDEVGQKAFKLSSFEAVQQRLSMDQGRCLMTSKPYNFGWFYQQIFTPWLQSGRRHPRIDVVQFDSLANPAFPRSEWDNAMKELPAWKFNMMYRGVFTRPAGLIYDCFDSAAHVVTPFPIPATWELFDGLDFGAVNTAAVFLAGEKDVHGVPTGRYFLFADYHPGVKLTPQQHVGRMSTCRKGRHPSKSVGGSASEDEWRNDFGAAGLYVREPPVKEVQVGIDRVYRAIRDGRLLVFRDCHRILDELSSYSYELDDSGQPTERIEDKETYHCADALRYACAELIRDGMSSTVPAQDNPAARSEVSKMPGDVFANIGSAG